MLERWRTWSRKFFECSRKFLQPRVLARETFQFQNECKSFACDLRKITYKVEFTSLPLLLMKTKKSVIVYTLPNVKELDIENRFIDVPSKCLKPLNKKIYIKTKDDLNYFIM